MKRKKWLGHCGIKKNKYQIENFAFLMSKNDIFTWEFGSAIE